MGVCVATSGTCLIGQDSCAPGATITPCNAASGASDCYCGTNAAGDTVCASVVGSMPCGCTTDAECRTREFPAALGGGTHPNALCFRTSAAGPCDGVCPNNVCAIPCQRFNNGK